MTRHAHHTKKPEGARTPYRPTETHSDTAHDTAAARPWQSAGEGVAVRRLARRYGLSTATARLIATLAGIRLGGAI